MKPQYSPTPLETLRGPKRWVLDRIVNPPPRHSFQIKPPPLFPRFFTRWMLVRIPLLLLVGYMFLFLWESNAFGVGSVNATPTAASCVTPSTPAGAKAGAGPTVHRSLSHLTSDGRASTPPASQVKPAAARTADVTAEGKYVVKSGDSLWVIARSLGVTVDELKAANNLNTTLLHVGDQLVIPTKTR